MTLDRKNEIKEAKPAICHTTDSDDALITHYCFNNFHGKWEPLVAAL